MSNPPRTHSLAFNFSRSWRGKFKTKNPGENGFSSQGICKPDFHYKSQPQIQCGKRAIKMCIHEFSSASNNEKPLLVAALHTHTHTHKQPEYPDNDLKLSNSAIHPGPCWNRVAAQDQVLTHQTSAYTISTGQVKQGLSVRPYRNARCFARESVGREALGRWNLVLPLIGSGRNLCKPVTSLG